MADRLPILNQGDPHYSMCVAMSHGHRPQSTSTRTAKYFVFWMPTLGILKSIVFEQIRACLYADPILVILGDLPG